MKHRDAWPVICRATLTLLSCLLFAGCVSKNQRLTHARSDFFAGKLEQAASRLDEGIERQRHDVDVYRLDRAMVALWQGEPREAERLLLEVRDRFTHLRQKDLAEEALSLATDDNRRAYAGEEYERVVLQCLLALANLMDDGEDVAAYAFQINQTQQEIIDRYRQLAGEDKDDDDGEGVTPQELRQVALGPYLFGAVREATHSNYDDAQRAYEQVVRWAPEFKPAVDDLERARSGTHSPAGHGVLYVVALVGRGPVKEEAFEVPTSQAMLVADRILSQLGDHSLTPTLAPIKVPVLRVTPAPVRTISIHESGRQLAQTQTITDVGQLAREQYEVELPRVLGRAVARRTAKKAALYAVKSAVDTQGVSELAMDMAGVLWEASESADTRCWGLLPDKIQVARLELPVGQHNLELVPQFGSGTAGTGAHPSTVTCTIEDGRNTYVMVHYPDRVRVGEVLQSTR